MVTWYAGTNESNLKGMPAPYELEYGLMDISSEDAGRAMDAQCTMYKNRLCQKRKLNFKFREPTADVTAQILQAINPEYIYVQYLDAMDNQWEIRQFYCGDRSAPLRWYWVGETRYKELSFDLIEV